MLPRNASWEVKIHVLDGKKCEMLRSKQVNLNEHLNDGRQRCVLANRKLSPIQRPNLTVLNKIGAEFNKHADIKVSGEQGLRKW